MASIRVSDPSLSDQFAANRAPVEVLGPNGRVLGAFIPGPVDPYLLRYGASRGDLMRRAVATGPGWTGPQVVALLRHLRG